MKLWIALAGLITMASLGWAADPTPGKNLFQLEIIAYDGNNCPQGDPSGHRIAIKADVSDNPNGQLANTLVRQNDILLTAGEFQVLDGNACVDGVARFQLPAQGIGGTLEDPTFQEYEVWARLVGKPGTGVDVRTCATGPGEDGVPNTADDEIVCSTEAWVSVRQKGPGSKPTFTNVSKYLLTICLDTDGNGTCDTRLALFDPLLYDYFWNWNTTGKAHAQLVFVEVPDV
jgi:hypothetical protein